MAVGGEIQPDLLSRRGQASDAFAKREASEVVAPAERGASVVSVQPGPEFRDPVQPGLIKHLVTKVRGRTSCFADGRRRSRQRAAVSHHAPDRLLFDYLKAAAPIEPHGVAIGNGDDLFPAVTRAQIHDQLPPQITATVVR